MDEHRALERRGLILEREIACHELACFVDDHVNDEDMSKGKVMSTIDTLRTRIEMIGIKLQAMSEVDAIIEDARVPST